MTDREELAKLAGGLYERGMTVHEVASTCSVSYGKAYALIKESGATFRRRGVRPKKGQSE